jgi:hypothetical protein
VKSRLWAVCPRCTPWNREVAWREAEEIAAIADTLPDDPLDRIKR